MQREDSDATICIDWTVWVETPLRRKVDAIVNRLLQQIGSPELQFSVIHGGDEHGYEAHFRQLTSSDWNETFVSIVEQLCLIAHKVTFSGEPRTNPAIAIPRNA